MVLPRALKIYKTADFDIQLKARFIFYMNIAMILAMVLIITSTSFTQITSTEYKRIYLPVVLPEFGLMLFFIGCLYLIIKGFYGLTAHLMMISVILCVWLVMWIDKGHIVSRLDTIVFIVALLNLAPLFITKYKSTILIYIFGNIALLIGFMWAWGGPMGLPGSVVVEYVIDTSVAILFAGILGYNIFNINKKTLDRALAEIKEREQAEEAVKESEFFRRRVFDSSPIPIVVMDTISLKFIDCNPAATKIYGFPTREATLGKTPIEVSAPIQYDGMPSAQKAMIYIDQALKEGSVIFNWKHQRPNGELWDAEVHLLNFQTDQKNLLQFSMIDVTESKKTERELKESEERFKTFSSLAREGLMIHENEIIADLNQSFADLLGYSIIEELIGKNGFEVIPFTPESKQIVLNHFLRNSDETFDIEIVNRNGKIIQCETRGTEIVYMGRKANLVYMLDITERKKAEKGLKESEEKYRYLMENMNEVVMMVDNDDRVLFVNKKFTEKLGYSLDEIIGEIGHKKLLKQEDHEIVLNENRKRINNENSQYELTFIGKDGNKIDFLISGAPMIDSEGKIVGSIGTMTDITERKLAENALIESEERYRKLIEAFPDIIMISDLNGNILFGNEALERITGISPADYTNPNRKAHIHPDDLHMVAEAIKVLLSENISQTGIIENRFIDSWGNVHWFSGIIAKIYLKEKLVLQTVSRDITEKKIIEEELEKHRNHLEMLVKEQTSELATKNEDLIATNEDLSYQREQLQVTLDALNATQNQLVQSEKMASLGILSAGIAHEINNPLNYINGGILGIETYFKDNLNEHFEYVSPLINAINVGVKRAADIVTSLSHYSRRDDLPRTDCEIHAIIDNCLVMLNNQIKNTIKIQKQYNGMPCTINCSEGKLHQAFLNIITNAVQSIETNGTITITSVIEDNKLIIKIADNGCGISKENLEKIFDPFFTTKEAGKGTGLGLSITYKIIQEHNGTIHYDSLLNKGTKVIITLPINKTETI